MKPTPFQELWHLVWNLLSNPWFLFGFLGQFVFMLRFLVQWIVSERRKESVIPVVFWYFSLAGGIILLTYAIHQKDPVFILGQATGSIIYTRNLMLIYKKRKSSAASPNR
jgi:lipid-A-disaccharide synthase-like uncharacterized protein